nr:RraA family protein [Streptomyces botrytidirepellens]
MGPAFTVRYAPVDESSDGTVGDFLDDVPPGSVIVIDNDGRTDVTVWGGIMSEVAAHRGIAGTVINGVCLDVSASLARNYPLFSRGRFMRTGKDRVRLVTETAERIERVEVAIPRPPPHRDGMWRLAEAVASLTAPDARHRGKV